MLINSYHRTYGLEYVVSRSGNNYGSRQYEEKLVAKAISCLRDGSKIPLHGDGSYVRDWTYVKDNVDGIMSIIEKGITNDCFNIAANNHLTNKEVVQTIIKKFNKTDAEIQYVEDRWGQDIRYSVDTSKITQATGWQPLHVGRLNLDFIDEEL
jgi:dTDP-glucose 4,6-dehydratase